MKLFGLLSPGNLDFFFQNQPTLGVKHLFDYRYDYRVAFVTHRRHLENLAAHRNCLNFCAFAKQTFVDKDFPRPGLLAYAQTPGFDRLLCNRKLLRDQS